MPTLEELRQKHSKFIYENYSWKISANDSKADSGSNLEITFQYKIDPDILFSPTLIINNVSQKMVDALGQEKVNSYVFNLGLTEMFSYWKCTTSPIIEIKAGSLDSEQIAWWHKLLIKGMGEFFFVNNIEFTGDSFVKIQSSSDKNHGQSNDVSDNANRNNGVLIPVGGGKDSSVTLEILGNLEKNGAENSDNKNNSFNRIGTFVVNPTPAALNLISIANTKNKIEVQRTIDSKLLDLNSQGYLNGHVPISAFFAFLSVFSADLFGYSYVAISNERSSNEGNAEFCDREINHQYSKTYEFEKDFQNYVKKYLPGNAPHYFSFLRPLYELQIARIFSGNTSFTSEMKKYHHDFRSCNRGQKTNSWCGKCSKCLFAYIIIHPFLDDEKINSYFDKNMLEDDSLWPIAQELLGVGEKKPLECVGTHEETIVAFYLAIKKHLDKNQKLPALLEKVSQEIISNEENLEFRATVILNSWNNSHSIPDKLSKVLKKFLKQKQLPQIISKLETSSIIILGLGREGLSSYKFLRKKFPEKRLLLVDEKQIENLGNEWQEIDKNDSNIKFATSIENIEYFEKSGKTLVIKSPGIPPTNPLIAQAKSIGAETTSNTNIFLKLLETLKTNARQASPIKTVGITGTKGKSTTTSMINHVLNSCNIQTFMGGNIGIPPLSLWTDIKKTVLSNMTNKNLIVVILELSSHQLSDMKMSPSIAVILDISPEHLDYYDSLENYIEAKSQISRFQTSDDIVIFDDNQEIPTKIANLGKAKKITFGFETNIKNNKITYKDEVIIDISQLPVIGKHNILNSVPSVIIAKELNCKTPDISNGLRTFKTLPHRLEMVAISNGITYINDSLSTTPKSAIAAIESFNNSPIVLIAGGHERNLDFTELAKTIKSSSVKHLILLPDTGKKILEAIQSQRDMEDSSDSANKIDHTFANNMEEAAAIAKSVAQNGDTVLLSPAAASFGYFKDYQDRGDQFRKFVNQ